MRLYDYFGSSFLNILSLINRSLSNLSSHAIFIIICRILSSLYMISDELSPIMMDLIPIYPSISKNIWPCFIALKYILSQVPMIEVGLYLYIFHSFLICFYIFVILAIRSSYYIFILLMMIILFCRRYYIAKALTFCSTKIRVGFNLVILSKKFFIIVF